MTTQPFDRRSLLRGAAAVTVTTAGVAALGTTQAPAATAAPAVLGTAIDYSAGVPSGKSVKAAGHIGAIRYVSQRRPGADWMLGKPVSRKETEDFAANGLYTASVYQFGRAETADWLAGANGASVHAPQAIALHAAAGGPKGVPIYVAIDDNPTREQYNNQIRPYLKAFAEKLEAAGLKLGIYANYYTIDWAAADGLGTHYWQHNWGSNGLIHPRANVHQVHNNDGTIDGVAYDLNKIYKQDWGQWKPGQQPAAPAQPAPSKPTQTEKPSTSAPADSTPKAQPAAQTQPTTVKDKSGHDLTINLPASWAGTSVTPEQVKQAFDLLTAIANYM